MIIDRSTLRRASEIHQDSYGVKTYLRRAMHRELLEVRARADFEALRRDLTASQHDAIQRAINEQ